MPNFFERLGIQLKHFSESEREAQSKAQAITSKAKQLLESKEALTAEKLIGAEELGTATLAIINKFAIILESPVIADDLDLVAGMLGRFGAQLTAAIHEGQEVKTGLGKWVLIFESLFHLNKKK